MLPFSGNVYLNLFYLSHAQVEYGELIKHKKDFLLRSKKFFDRITDSTWKEKGKNKKAYSLKAKKKYISETSKILCMLKKLAYIQIDIIKLKKFDFPFEIDVKCWKLIFFLLMTKYLIFHFVSHKSLWIQEFIYNDIENNG